MSTRINTRLEYKLLEQLKNRPIHKEKICDGAIIFYKKAKEDC